jgi:NosR/NirI family nitrous oxide reductase transcriptional regulator
MHCQELYHDDQRCLHMVQLRLKREKRAALRSPGEASGGKGRAGPIITHAGKPIREPATADLPVPQP